MCRSPRSKQPVTFWSLCAWTYHHQNVNKFKRV
uniref:Uncharacterized protein n=1 Tax=Rhizophora mucronata TaxID=61149 RepID=A0A2P2Q8N6_RHIMU